jgi:hypothetical protein
LKIQGEGGCLFGHEKTQAQLIISLPLRSLIEDKTVPPLGRPKKAVFLRKQIGVFHWFWIFSFGLSLWIKVIGTFL